MANTYLTITGSTNPIASYSTLPLLDNGVESHENQLRVFMNGEELVVGDDFTVSPTTLTITLTETPIVSDDLLIFRQTRMDRSYVDFTDVARFTASDINLGSDQVAFLCQEITEEGIIAGLIDSTGTYPVAKDDSTYSATYDESTDDTFSFSEIILLPTDRVDFSHQLVVYKNSAVLELTTDYTVDVDDQTITLDDPLIVTDILKIRRETSQFRHFPTFKNASSLSSTTTGLNFTQLLFMIEELPYWFGLTGHVIRNRKFPRRIHKLIYSGPGDHFSYKGLPWNPDSTIVVYINDLPIDPDDYTIDYWNWEIIFDTPTGSTDHVTITVIHHPINITHTGDLVDNVNEEVDVAVPPPLDPILIEDEFDSDYDYESDTEVDDADLLSTTTEEADPKVIRLAFPLHEVRGVPLDSCDLGMVWNDWEDDVAFPTRAEDNYTIWVTESDWDISEAPSINVDGEVLATNWVFFAGLTELVQARIDAGDDTVYLVIQENHHTVHSFYSANAEENPPDGLHDYKGSRLVINDAALPDLEVIPAFDGFYATFYRPNFLDTVGMTKIITSTFIDYESELPIVLNFQADNGLDAAAGALFDEEYAAFHIPAEGTYTLTGTLVVNTGTTSASNALVATPLIPNMGFTVWDFSIDGAQGTTADCNSKNNGSGTVFWTLIVVCDGTDIDRYLTPRMSGGAVHNFDLTVNTFDFTP